MRDRKKFEERMTKEYPLLYSDMYGDPRETIMAFGFDIGPGWYSIIEDLSPKIEDLIFELKKKYTVIIVTHNMQQAARISDYTGYLYLGKLIEFGHTRQVFENPREDLTEKYITGRFG